MKNHLLLTMSLALGLSLPTLTSAQTAAPAPKLAANTKQQYIQKARIVSVDSEKSRVTVRFENGKTAVIKLSPDAANKMFRAKGRQSLRMDVRLNNINRASRTAMISLPNAAPFEVPLNNELPPGAELWPPFDWGLSCDGWPPACEGEISFTWWF